MPGSGGPYADGGGQGRGSRGADIGRTGGATQKMAALSPEKSRLDGIKKVGLKVRLVIWV